MTALILVAVLLPGSSFPDTPDISGFDKMVHFILFLMLAVSVQLDFNLSGSLRLSLAAAALIVFSSLTEALQLLVEGRSADIFDLFADIVGLLAGLAARRPLATFALRFYSGIRRRLKRHGVS